MTALFVGLLWSDDSAELAAPRFVLLDVDQFVQAGCGVFDVIVLVLAGAALRGDHEHEALFRI
jgi:hypothetical protein